MCRGMVRRVARSKFAGWAAFLIARDSAFLVIVAIFNGEKNIPSAGTRVALPLVHIWSHSFKSKMSSPVHAFMGMPYLLRYPEANALREARLLRLEEEARQRRAQHRSDVIQRYYAREYEESAEALWVAALAQQAQQAQEDSSSEEEYNLFDSSDEEEDDSDEEEEHNGLAAAAA